MSLFSGCGGLDLGFKELGFDLVYACDSDPAAVTCFAHNVDHRVCVRDVTSENFHDDLRNLGTADVVLGGFPCQGFSKAGPKRQDDARNALYLEMLNAVARLRPSIFIAENVDGISQNFGGIYVNQIVRDFSELGYDVEHRIIEAASFGLPQYRRRIFFVGARSDLPSHFQWPVPTHAATARNGEFKVSLQPRLWDTIPDHAPKRPRTIRDAIGDISDLSQNVPDHQVSGGWPDSYQAIFGAIREGQKLCNVRHAPTSVRTWDVPAAFGRVSSRERLVLETIARHRRHKRYGDIPNGNPLPMDEVARLSDLGDIVDEIESLLSQGYLKALGGGVDLKGAMFCSGMFKRPLWDEPAPTVLTNFHSPRYFLHPSADRPFSLREAARLQGFPDSFVFLQTGIDLIAAYRLVGNAVPPPLSRHFAAAAERFLEATGPKALAFTI